MVIVSTDSTANTGAQNSARGRNPVNMSWRRPANPAALEATERKAATGTGEPSYVSGAQKWNGTEDTLKANPATTNSTAPMATGCGSPCKEPAMSSSRREPVTP
jgi:hypothetical protein